MGVDEGTGMSQDLNGALAMARQGKTRKIWPPTLMMVATNGRMG
jgi:hypothetical protein